MPEEAALVVAMREQPKRLTQGIDVPTETTASAVQPPQKVTDLGIASLDTVRLALVGECLVLAVVIQQGRIRVEAVAVKLLAGARHGVYYGLHRVKRALLHHLPANDAAGQAIYCGGDVDPPFFSPFRAPMKTWTSSNSTVADTGGVSGSEVCPLASKAL